MPRTSVIMPAYEAGDTIAAAVESALAQTEQDIEVIVVDDGSREPMEAALGALRSDPRLKLLRHERNRQAPAARNTALAAATAPLISQLDSDDEWAPAYVERMLAEFEDPAVGLAYCNAAVRGHPGGVDRYISHPEVHPIDTFPKLADANPVAAVTATMRTHAVRAVGGYAEWLWVCDDYHLYMKLALAGWRFAYVDERLAHYRWPSSRGGQSFDRRSADRDALKMFAGLALRHPTVPGPKRQVRLRARRELERLRS